MAQTSLASKVKITKHAKQRLVERFGDASDRELSDLIRNARLFGETYMTMDEDHFQFARHRNIFKNESGSRQIRLYKDLYFVFVSGKGAGRCRILVTVIQYESDWKEKKLNSKKENNLLKEEDIGSPKELEELS